MPLNKHDAHCDKSRSKSVSAAGSFRQTGSSFVPPGIAFGRQSMIAHWLFVSKISTIRVAWLPMFLIELMFWCVSEYCLRL